MGVFSQNILITNYNDLAWRRARCMKEPEVRSLAVPFPVDSGAFKMCINETVQHQLGLPIEGEHEVIMAGCSARLLKMATALQIQAHNRETRADALVLPGDTVPLSGGIPMEALDVLIGPEEGKLVLPKDRPSIVQSLLVPVR